MSNEKTQQTLILIKPDALKNSLTGYILSQLSEYHTGLVFAASKIVDVSDMLAGEHYAEHKGKAFFPSLLQYIKGILHFPEDAWKRKVKAFVMQGDDAILAIRNICGPTNPHEAREKKPGCIRALGTLVNITDKDGNIIGNRMDNLIHASANPADAEREIKLWFRPCDFPALLRAFPTATCEDHYYFKDGKLLTEYVKGSMCLVAPGDIVWKSDMEALVAISKGAKSEVSLETVAAKYLL